MKYQICENCMKEHQVEKNDSTPFPSFTLLGGFLGALGSVFLGPVLFIPVGLIAGAATDVARCQNCGSQENVFELMEQKEDKWGFKRYNRVPFRLYEDVEPLDNQFTLDEKKEYVFDELEGQLTLYNDVEMGDYDSSFDVADTSIEASDAGFDNGDGGFDSGFGDAGDGGGSPGGGK